MESYNDKQLKRFWFEEAVNIRLFMDFHTTKELSMKDYINMGIKILIFHMDCLDCRECQDFHQKLNSEIQQIEKKGYTLLLYYCRADQDVFEAFRSEFKNKIDYVIVDAVEEEFLEGYTCNSSLFEIHGNYIANRYRHPELSKIITDFCTSSTEVDDAIQVKSPEELSPHTSLSLNLPLDFLNNSGSSSPRKRNSGDPKKGLNTQLLKKFSQKISSALLSPRSGRSSKSPTTPPDVPDIFTETSQFSKEFESQPNIILHHSVVRDVLVMGYRVLLFHMDNLRCQQCLDFHKNLGKNMNFLLGEMITPLLNYCRIDQNMFELLNKYSKNKIEILKIPEIAENELQNFDKCEACCILVLDEDTFVTLKHDEISMESLAKSCGFNLEKMSKPDEQKEPKQLKKRKGSFKNIFKKPSQHKIEITTNDQQTTSEEYTPKFIMESMSLDDVLKDEKLRNNYFQYLKQECAEENMIFYENVQKYKQLSWSERKVHAKKMVKLFLETNSKYELNTSTKIKNNIQKQLQLGKADLFDELLKNTMRMMDFDVLKRFLETQTL